MDSWEKITDSTGAIIYFNRATGERRSDNPAGPAPEFPSEPSEPATFRAAHQTFDFFKDAFNVDYEEVKERLKFALNPTNDKFLSLIEYHPDLYGPFWIATTFIFVVAAAGNLSLAMSDAEVGHSYSMITKAVVVIYLVTFGVPAGLWGALLAFGSDLRYIQLTCLYGYSLTIYLPITLICVIQSEALRWIAVMAAVASSTWFLLSNLKGVLEREIQSRQYIVLGLVLFGQLVLGLTLKTYFFAYLYSGKKGIY